MGKIGFRPEDIAERYDVSEVTEDSWHKYSTNKTYASMQKWIDNRPVNPEQLVLNAGSGVYRLDWNNWTEIRLDLFPSPLEGDPSSVCGDLCRLEFKDNMFDAVVCVGEVLSYCNPSTVFSEIKRILKIGGIFIFDYGSTKSARHWFTKGYGRAADLVVVPYNGSPEKVWIYHPKYIEGILTDNDFYVKDVIGIHFWSCLLKKISIPTAVALKIESLLTRSYNYTAADTVIVFAGVAQSD
jgi:SAM-dependent methyltransferase